jgi:hypothetical protein
MLTCTVVFVLGCNWPYLAVVKHVNKWIELNWIIIVKKFISTVVVPECLCDSELWKMTARDLRFSRRWRSRCCSSGCNAVLTCMWQIPTFRKNTHSPASGLKRQHVPPKRWYQATSPHGVTTLKTNIDNGSKRQKPSTSDGNGFLRSTLRTARTDNLRIEQIRQNTGA